MNEELTSLLRRYDPAADKSLSANDRARILRNVLTARAGHTPRRRLILAVAMLALAVTAIVFVIRTRTIAPVTIPPQIRIAQVKTAAVRQIQYATPGGTRIVWTLDPNFHM
jgi:hypothetical protein